MSTEWANRVPPRTAKLKHVVCRRAFRAQVPGMSRRLARGAGRRGATAVGGAPGNGSRLAKLYGAGGPTISLIQLASVWLVSSGLPLFCRYAAVTTSRWL